MLPLLGCRFQKITLMKKTATDFRRGFFTPLSVLVPDPVSCYGYTLLIVLGKGIASRMCSMPHSHAVTRSTPMPNPE